MRVAEEGNHQSQQSDAGQRHADALAHAHARGRGDGHGVIYVTHIRQIEE